MTKRARGCQVFQSWHRAEVWSLERRNGNTNIHAKVHGCMPVTAKSTSAKVEGPEHALCISFLLDPRILGVVSTPYQYA